MALRRVVFVCALLVALSAAPALAAEPPPVELMVRQGDTLGHICQQYLEEPGRVAQVARLNGIKDPNRIFPNQKIVIPVRLLRGVVVDGTVAFVKGVVEMRASENGPWHPVLARQEIGQGMAIRTGPQSGLEITYPEGVSLLLRENTELKIVDARAKGALQHLYRFFVHIGQTVSRIRRGTGTDNRYEIITPSAVGAARGTEYRVAVAPDQSSRLEVLEGKVGLKSAKGRVEVSEAHGAIVRPHAPPMAPRRLLPPPAPAGLLPLYRAMPLAFAFEAVAGADHAMVVLARDYEGKDIVRERPLRSGERLEIIGVDDGTYFLSGRSVDRFGLEGLSGVPVVVQVRVNPLPPFIRNPRDGEERRESSPRMEWLAVSDAVGYHLQVAADPEFATPVAEEPHLTESHYKTPALDYGNYYFRMASIAADGYEGVWSDVIRFVLSPPPPAPPVEAPAQSGKEIFFRWHDLGPGVSYHLQMAREETFKEIVLDDKSGQPSATIPLPDKPGTYYVRVSTIDGDGFEGSFSKPQSFPVKNNLDKWMVGGWLTVVVAIIVL